MMNDLKIPTVHSGNLKQYFSVPYSIGPSLISISKPVSTLYFITLHRGAYMLAVEKCALNESSMTLNARVARGGGYSDLLWTGVCE